MSLPAVSPVTLPTGSTAVTQSESDNSTDIATDAFANNAASIIQFGIDKQPASPNVANDEFNVGSSIDTGGTRFASATPWNKSQNVTGLSNTVGYDMLTLYGATGLGTYPSFGGYGQVLAAGTCTYQAKGRATGAIGTAGSIEFGFGLRESATSKCEFFVCALFGSAGGVLGINMQSVSGTSFTGGFAGIVGPTYFGAIPMYLQFARTATNIVYSWSLDGNVWTQFDSHALTTHFTATPNEIYAVAAQNAAGAFAVSFDWFRRIA
jgi:hypothetical protein